MIDALDIDLAWWPERLHTVLDEAQAASGLPDAPAAYDALDDFVVRVRLER
ncbi:hypothetical protein [Streptomyces tendae]|uniref:hypothetical protein n=1 Tax=Streptomyces tendae TaxID=1932 RepID=UPI003CD0CA7D